MFLVKSNTEKLLHVEPSEKRAITTQIVQCKYVRLKIGKIGRNNRRPLRAREFYSVTHVTDSDNGEVPLPPVHLPCLQRDCRLLKPLKL